MIRTLKFALRYNDTQPTPQGETWQTHSGEQTGTARLQYAQRSRSQQRHRCRTQLRPAPYRLRPVTHRSTGR